MSSQPGFVSAGSDVHVSGADLSKTKAEYDIDKVATSNPLPKYEVDEDGSSNPTRADVPLETAQDLVTTIIHVEDDPTLNPYTFRMVFLGMLLNPVKTFLLADNVPKAAAFLSSVQFYRRSFISSPKPFMFR